MVFEEEVATGLEAVQFVSLTRLQSLNFRSLNFRGVKELDKKISDRKNSRALIP